MTDKERDRERMPDMEERHREIEQDRQAERETEEGRETKRPTEVAKINPHENIFIHFNCLIGSIDCYIIIIVDDQREIERQKVTERNRGRQSETYGNSKR